MQKVSCDQFILINLFFDKIMHNNLAGNDQLPPLLALLVRCATWALLELT